MQGFIREIYLWLTAANFSYVFLFFHLNAYKTRHHSVLFHSFILFLYIICRLLPIFSIKESAPDFLTPPMFSFTVSEYRYLQKCKLVYFCKFLYEKIIWKWPDYDYLAFIHCKCKACFMHIPTVIYINL